VDLERRHPIDLLPDRSSRSFQRWLAEHPGVEVITRDRAGLYAEGGTRGAPNAIQVADRFHLICNLATAAERFLQQKRFQCFQLRVRPAPFDNQAMGPQVAAPKPDTALKAQHRQRRVERYEEVRQLYREGFSQKAISRLLGMERKTVRRFLRAQEFPERVASKRYSHLDRFRSYLEQRWSEGCHNATQLWREVQEQGYEGCRGMVTNLVTGFRAPGTKYFRASASTNRSRLYRVTPSPVQVASLLMRHPDKLAARDREWLQHLFDEQPDIACVHSLIQDFSALLRTRNADGLSGWVHRAVQAGIPAVTSFVAGLARDHAAVEAAFRSPWSNGQVEGHVHRLKLIKRQMYGRAGFVLLRRRVLPYSVDQHQPGP
jgi:transposase